MLLRLHSEPDVAHWHSVCTGVQTYCTSADISDADDTTPGDMLAAHAVALDLRARAGSPMQVRSGQVCSCELVGWVYFALRQWALCSR